MVRCSWFIVHGSGFVGMAAGMCQGEGIEANEYERQKFDSERAREIV